MFMMFQDMAVPKGEYVIRSIGKFELLPTPTSDTIYLTKVALNLIRKIYFKGRVYKKAGVLLSRIVPDTSIQGNLFNESINNNRLLMLTIDNINSALEPDMLRLASAGMSKHWKMRQESRSPRYTTVWNEISKIIF